MSLQLSEVNDVIEFAEVVKVEHRAYAKPENTLWEVLKGPTIEECTERQWGWHKGTPNSHWLAMKEGDKVIGGGEWIIHETNPFAKPQPIVKATWWPEGIIIYSFSQILFLKQMLTKTYMRIGPLKIISDHILEEFFKGRPTVMNRPHLRKNTCLRLINDITYPQPC